MVSRRKELTVNDVLYVPEIRKNLVFVWWLKKHGFCLVLEYNKFVLTKNRIFIGKDYAHDGMLKFHVITNIHNIKDINNSSTYLFDSSNV